MAKQGRKPKLNKKQCEEVKYFYNNTACNMSDLARRYKVSFGVIQKIIENRYVYNQPQGNLMGPLQGIIQFNIDRNLTKFDSVAEFKMLQEELMEFFSAENTNEQVDALCDIIVVATGALHKLGHDPETALLEVVKEITSRQGTLNPETGKWQKDPDQDPKTLYKANYALARS